MSLEIFQDLQYQVELVPMCIQMVKLKLLVSRFNQHSDIIQDLFAVILKTLVSALTFALFTL